MPKNRAHPVLTRIEKLRRMTKEGNCKGQEYFTLVFEELKMLRCTENELYDALKDFGERIRTEEFLVQNDRPPVSVTRPSDPPGVPMSTETWNQRYGEQLDSEGVMNTELADALGYQRARVSPGKNSEEHGSASKKKSARETDQ